MRPPLQIAGADLQKQFVIKKEAAQDQGRMNRKSLRAQNILRLDNGCPAGNGTS